MPARRRWGGAVVAGLACALVILAVGGWRMLGPDREPARTPSVAVLPFVSMAGETSAYLGPGVAEDVISMLARSPDVLVMARGSSFAYGDAPRDVREIGKALGVDYVLEGSVRREGDKLRITAQLEDARSGQQVWADRFDRAGSDPWALVDEVSGKIIGAMVGEHGEIKRAQFREAWGKDSTSLGEYDYFLRGLDVYSKAKTPEESARGGRIGPRGWSAIPTRRCSRRSSAGRTGRRRGTTGAATSPRTIAKRTGWSPRRWRATTCRRRCSGRRIG